VPTSTAPVLTVARIRFDCNAARLGRLQRLPLRVAHGSLQHRRASARPRPFDCRARLSQPHPGASALTTTPPNLTAPTSTATHVRFDLNLRGQVVGNDARSTAASHAAHDLNAARLPRRPRRAIGTPAPVRTPRDRRDRNAARPP
jgi:hypothetical protein